MDGATLREFATEAMRYWESRRIVYNAVLALIVIGYFVVGLPASKHALSLNLILFIFLLAVLANVAYCAAYVPDVFAQASGFRAIWLKYRWILFLIGLIFASIITRFWSMGLFTTGNF
jgi:hypothetical protein